MTRHEAIARVHAIAARAELSAPERVRATAHRADARIEASSGSAVVYIYDEIGGFGVWASELCPQLAALNVGEIEVRLNSPGGDYFDGAAIANTLAAHPARVTVHVDGLAASAASVIAMAGDEVIMHPGAQMMIHDALCMTYGNASEHTARAALLDGVSAGIAELYAMRAGGEASEWRERMQAETWMSGDEAVAAGLADRHVSRETEQPAIPEAETPGLAARFPELIATWRSLPQTSAAPPAAAPPPVADQAAALPLSELLCSAFREAVA